MKPLLRFQENHATQVNIILPANSSTSINLDLLDDGKLNFFRDDPLRSPIRKSHMSVSSKESCESHSYAQSRNSFHGMDIQRCSIRGPRDSFFREPRESFSWDSRRFSERQAMLRVLFDFEACDDDDISVSRGELVKVLNKDDEDWWWVENEYRDQGFVPRSFLWPCGCYGRFVTSFNFPAKCKIGASLHNNHFRERVLVLVSDRGSTHNTGEILMKYLATDLVKATAFQINCVNNAFAFNRPLFQRQH